MNAVLVEIASDEPLSEVCAGEVKFWNERGYGFVSAGIHGVDAFIHMSALPQDEEGYLTEGDILEFQTIEGKKGLEARNIRVVGRAQASDHLTNFADMGPPGWVDRLADLAELEPWEYKNAQGAEPLPILRSYIRHTFRRLEEMTNGVRISLEVGG